MTFPWSPSRPQDDSPPQTPPESDQPSDEQRHPHYDTPGSLRADEPIRSSKRDLLDRETLVDTIARQIAAIDHREPITIALTAPWGAGKTSFLNLLRTRLSTVAAENGRATPGDGDATDEGTDATDEGHGPANAPIIINFNPWLYGNVEDLVKEFFAEIGKELDCNDDELLRELAGVLLESVGPIVQTFAPWVPSAPIAWAGRELLKQDTIREKKETINNQLKRLPTRIVVFIDDIDRLEPDVTKLLFRMVRLIANFKNTTYVLAFDRAVVERHLAHGKYEPGREYLEKIIQVNYRIPEPESDVIRHILRHELDDVRVSVEQQFLKRQAGRADRPGQTIQHLRRDSDRYERIVTRHFAVHFATVRSIKRYVNALRLALPPAAGTVDLVDFYIIELIRLFYPELYRKIALAADTLVVSAQNDDGGNTAERRKELDRQLSTWIPGYTDEASLSPTSKSLLSLLYELFPDLSEIECRQAVRARWTTNARVCSDVSFDRYFLLSAPASDLPEAIHDRLKEALGGGDLTMEEGIRECIRGARKRGIVPNLLEELAARTGALDAADAAQLATVICSCDVRDDLQLSDRHEDHRPLSELVRRCIAKQPNEDVEDVISGIIEDGSALFTVVNVFEDIFRAGLAIQDPVQAIGRLKSEVGKKIVAATEEEAFWDGTRWRYLLRLASTYFHESVGDTMNRCAADDGRLLAFCETVAESLEAEEPGSESTVSNGDILRWVESVGSARLVQVGQGDGEYTEKATALLVRLKAILEQAGGAA